MPTSYTSLLGLALPVTGELAGTWGDTVNDYLTKYLDAAVAGAQTISGSQTAVTLTTTNGSTLTQAGSGSTGSAQYQIINCTGNPASLLTITVPAQSKAYLVLNATSTSQSVKVVGAGPTTGVTMVSGERALIAWDGSDFVKVATSTADGVTTLSFGTTGLTPNSATAGAITVAGTLVAANGGTGQSSYTTGDLLYATGSTALSKLGIGTNGQVLTSTGTAPQWSTLSGVAVTTFSAGTTGLTPNTPTSGAITLGGTLATTNGGTGLTSFSANQVFYASSTSAIAQSANLTFDGTTLTANNFTDSSLTSGRVTYATTGGNLTDSANLLYSGTDLTVYGITVGRGAGAVSTNTAVGASALAANTSGIENNAFGNSALLSNTTGGSNVAFGTNALRTNITGSENTALGHQVLYASTGSFNTGAGTNTLRFNTSGASNTAFGHNSLFSNTTASNNTAVGYQAAYANTTGGENTAVGFQALLNNTTGSDNAAFGLYALVSNTTGGTNTAIGRSALNSNTTASNNTAVGYQAGYSNTTGALNTFIGFSAGAGNTTGAGTVAIGYRAGILATTGGYNTFVGLNSGENVTTGTINSFFGIGSGGAMTTGSKNTIIGVYNGNQGGLDIRTASNNIVLSDGDGNPRIVNNGTVTSVGGPIAFSSDTNANPTSFAQIRAADGSVSSTDARLLLGNSNGAYANMRIVSNSTSNLAVDAVAGNNTNSPLNLLLNINGGKIGMGLASIDASGGVLQLASGITFPATQSASSNANTLDDYEEGTWTPALSGSFSYTSRSGKYTKIGNVVTVSGDIIWASNSSGSTSWAVTGLPFTVSDYRVPATLGYMAGVDNLGGKQIIATTSSGQTSFDFWAINDNATPTNIDAANISSTGEVQFCIVYHTS